NNYFNFVNHISDTEPPVFTDCPSDVLIETGESEVRVNWPQPKVTDNSGAPPILTSNRHSGSLFSAPGSYEVTYRAADSSGNVATCSFRITLKKKTCPSYPPPTNGALACLDLSDDPTCAVMCKGGFDFVSDPALLYLCSRGQWIMLGSPQGGGLPWPSCSEVTPNHGLKMGQFPQYYFDGNAPNTLDTIKTNFISLLGAFGICRDDQKCKKDLVNVQVDTEPPVLTDCPSDILIETGDSEVRVNWPRPNVTDNSGAPPLLTSNRQSGSLFSAPGSYEVIYTARDSSGNVATCSFRITLKKKTCPIYPPPTNGALACLPDDSACAVMCKGGFDFVSNPAWLYLCSKAQWITIPFPTGLPWPNCSGKIFINMGTTRLQNSPYL
ncbi:unnamed protein product, partial [Porites lobata]